MTGPFITTPVITGTHPRCGAVVLHGHAEGVFARVDLTPLTRAGEIAAICHGLQTYTLTRTGLIHRDAGRIAGTALVDAGPVLAEHACHRHIPAHQRATTPTTPAPTTEGIPY